MTTARPALAVTVFCDYICPFCYVGDARLDQLRSDYALEVDWSYFEIHPDNPAEGRPVEELGYPPEVWARMMRNLETMAAAEGLALAERRFTTNSRSALLLAESAKDGDADGFARLHKRLFAAYFADGVNIGDRDELAEIAEECGIPEATRERAWSDAEVERRLDRQIQRAAALGVHGVPAYLFGRYLVEGAAPIETLREAAALAVADAGEPNDD